jgi:hypothetical protein
MANRIQKIDGYTSALTQFLISFKPLGRVKGELMRLDLRLGQDMALKSLYVKYAARAKSFEIPVRSGSAPRLALQKKSKVDGHPVQPETIALWAASVEMENLAMKLIQVHPTWWRQERTWTGKFACRLQYKNVTYSHAGLRQWIEREVVRDHPFLLDDAKLRDQVIDLYFESEPRKKGFNSLFKAKTYRCYDFSSFSRDLQRKAHKAVVDHVLGQFRKIRKPAPIELLRFGTERKRWCQPDFVQAVQSGQTAEDKATRFSLFNAPYRTNDSNVPRILADDFLLDSFAKKHGLRMTDFDWSANQGLLRLVLQYELHATAGKLLESLTNNRRIEFSKRPKVGVGDELDWKRSTTTYRAIIEKRVGKLLANRVARDAFAVLCYRDSANQKWLRGC